MVTSMQPEDTSTKAGFCLLITDHKRKIHPKMTQISQIFSFDICVNCEICG
jgi:hypothetical protein